MSTKTAKTTIYLPPELYEDAKDLARIDGETWPGYVIKLLKADINQRADKLKAFRELRSK